MCSYTMHVGETEGSAGRGREQMRTVTVRARRQKMSKEGRTFETSGTKLS